MGAVRSGWRERSLQAVAASLLALSCGRTVNTDGADAPDKHPPVMPPAEQANCAVALDGREGRHCAVYQDGSVWCWGFDWLNQPSDFKPSSLPTKVAGIAGAQQVILGPRHSCALTDSGLLCWGDNESGQIDDSGAPSLPPTSPQLSGYEPSPIKGFSLGDQQTCALTYLSHAYCRGVDRSSAAAGVREVVFPGPPDTTMPGHDAYLIDDKGLLFGLSDLADPPAFLAYGDDNAWLGQGVPNCLLKRSGSLWCDSDQPDAPDRTLIAVASLGERVIQAANGSTFMCALSDGRVWCQGTNVTGQTGTGDTSSRAAGHFVESLEDVRSISANAYSACALKGDGSVWCWGKDQDGLNRLEPAQVSSCVEQTTVPLDPPRLAATRPNAFARFAEAGLARAQAMCGCAFAGKLDKDCVDGENAAPNRACIEEMGPNDRPLFECQATSLWQQAECYADQICTQKGTVQGCFPTLMCPPHALGGRVCDGLLDCEDGADERYCP